MSNFWVCCHDKQYWSKCWCIRVSVKRFVENFKCLKKKYWKELGKLVGSLDHEFVMIHNVSSLVQPRIHPILSSSNASYNIIFNPASSIHCARYQCANQEYHISKNKKYCVLIVASVLIEEQFSIDNQQQKCTILESNKLKSLHEISLEEFPLKIPFLKKT